MTPRVTVLMTVYNGQAYLAEAIESVLTQGFRDFEFLIIDDASTDGSVALIRSYADPRIRLLFNPQNLGQNPSLNIGLKEAHGKIVVRIDQDDMCLPGRIEKQVRYLDEHPDVAVVGSWAYSIDEHTVRRTVWQWRVRNFGELVGLLLVGRCALLHPAVAYRRAAICDAGGYDQAYAMASDYALWIDVLLRGHRAAVIEEPLAMYRVHGGRQSATKAHKHWEDTARAHEKLVKPLLPESDPRLVGSLLRIEPGVWEQHLSKSVLTGLIDSVDRILDNSARVLRLKSEEIVSLKRTVYKWLGPGVRVARKLKGCPSFIFSPVLFGLSPLLIPGMRPLVTKILDRVRPLLLLPHRVRGREKILPSTRGRE